jgi:hypothetical protein
MPTFAGFLLRLIFVLKTEAICSTENSVDFHRTTLRYVPEDRSLRSGNLESNIREESLHFCRVYEGDTSTAVKLATVLDFSASRGRETVNITVFGVV